MSGLRITRLKIAHVGILRGVVDLGALDPGMTLITGPNEIGKSTVVEALRAALFEKHGAKHQGLKGLQSHGSKEGPEVWVEFELDGRAYTLHKRFLVSPESSLHIAEPEAPPVDLIGDAADERVWADLKAQAPGPRGAKTDDMGVWGLLWVNQDGAASADPGGLLGQDSRNTLKGVIERQVSTVLGGARGERLGELVAERYARHWTPAGHVKGQGSLGQARAAVTETEAQVNALEAQQNAVEADAQRLEGIRTRRKAAEAQRPLLLTEVRQAEEATAEVARLRHAFERADAEKGAAEARAEGSDAAVSARRDLAQRATAATAQAEQTAAAVGELRPQEQAAAAEVTRRAQVLSAAEETTAQAREGWRAARDAVQSARAAHERIRVADAWAEVKTLLAKQAELTEDADAALDEATWRQLRAHADALAAAEAQLQHTGTRLRVGADEPFTLDWVVGRPQTRTVAAFGEVELEPAGEALSEARAHRDAAAGQLSALLERLGVADPDEARQRRAARAAEEAREQALAEQLAMAAPEGTEALRAAAESARSKAAQLSGNQRAAADLDERAKAQQAERASHSVDAEALSTLQALDADRSRADAARAAAATRLKITLREDLRLSQDGVERAPDAAGMHDLHLTEGTDLKLGGAVDIRVEPGGEGLAALNAQAQTSEAALRDALGALGHPDLDAARRSAQQRAEADAALAATRAQLEVVAPEGISALEQQVEEARQAVARAEQRVRAAEALEGQRHDARARVQANPLTADLADQVNAAAAALARHQQTVREHAAVLRVDADEHICEGPTEGAHAGQPWWVTPGRGGLTAHAERDQREATLTEALRAAGAADLDAARARWEKGLSVRQALDEVIRGLRRHAPDGPDALRARAEALDPAPPEPPELRPLEEAEAESEAALHTAEDARDDARRAHDQAQDRASALRAEVAAAQASADAARQTAEEATLRLRTQRAEHPDAKLEQAAQAARADARAQADAAQEAKARLDALNPALVTDDVQRARGALADLDGQLKTFDHQAAGLEAVIARAATTGTFETLTEARAHLAQAQRDLARAQREADAADLLHKVVKARYEAAQQRFLAPVVEKATPYLQAIRPGTQLSMTTNLEVDAVTRAGASEKFQQLSGGTREQLSVIVRLALAKVLAKDGAALPLILDDTMGWTDDDRFLQMVRILRNAAKEMQLIILTCHPSRFTRLQAPRTIDLEALREKAV